MANLFWKQKGKPTLNLISTPFSTEEEFEKLIFETKEILEDIFLLKRQIRGGKKDGHWKKSLTDFVVYLNTVFLMHLAYTGLIQNHSL